MSKGNIRRAGFVATTVAAAGSLAMAGVAAALPAGADDVAAQHAQKAGAPAGQQVELTSTQQVRAASVQGTFSFSQGEVDETATIARNLGGADRVLCGAGEGIALAGSAQDALDAASWQISVGGDVENAFTASIGDLAETGSAQRIMGCSCAGNPADGRASANAAVAGVTLASVLERAGVASDANTITFTCADGMSVSLPLAYVMQRACLIAYGVNGAPLADSVGGTNQLWLGSTSARYFARDIVSIELSCEDQAPAAPGAKSAGAQGVNLPNVGVVAGA